MIYNKKKYSEARMVAVKAHSNQSYDSIFPYEKHLDDVVAVMERFGFSGKFIVAAYLHDTMEDNGLSFKKIAQYFGIEVAEMVFSVSDEAGRTREEKKLKTLPKTALCPDGITLKLADRIANIEHGGKISMYREEHENFKKHLFNNTNKDALVMWGTIEELLKI